MIDLSKFTPLLSLYFQKFAVALAIMLAFWLAAFVLSSLVQRVAERQQARRRSVFLLLSRVVHAGLLVIGGATALGTIGVNVTAIVASLGLTGFALGFAFKDALSNLLAGVLILIYEPFSEGDRIRIGDAEGSVTQIDLRYTTLRGEGKRFLVPNSNLISNTVTVNEQEAP